MLNGPYFRPSTVVNKSRTPKIDSIAGACNYVIYVKSAPGDRLIAEIEGNSVLTNPCSIDVHSEV